MSRLRRMAAVIGTLLVLVGGASAPAVEAAEHRPAPPSADRMAEVRARMEQLRRAITGRGKRGKKRSSTLAELCKRWGVEPPADGWEEPGQMQGTDVQRFSRSASAHDRDAIIDALKPTLTFGGGSVFWGDTTGVRFNFSAADAVSRWGALIPPDEINGPGTRVISGLPSVDPAGRFSPYLARGMCGNLGIYERQLRNPLIERNVASLTEGLTEAAWSASPPRRVPEQHEEAARDMAEWVAGWTVDAPWWPQYVEAASSCLAFGFSPFEAVWGVDDQSRPYIQEMAYREQSTVDRWMWDARGKELLAARFRSTGDHGTSYLLPARGAHILDHRLMVVTYRGRGNAIEGRPAGRSLDVLIVLWELLWKIAGACYERFGSPILVTRYDAALLALPGKTPDAGEVDVFLDFLSILTALDTPTLEVPLGLLAEYVGPSGEMPDVLPLIERIEATVDRSYATQAMGLGQRSAHGSYALASVQDSDFTRALPAIGRVIGRPFEDVLGRMAEEVWGIPARWAPRIGCTPEVDVDASKWLTDALRLHTAAPSMPTEMRTRGLELLGLGGQLYDEMAEDEEEIKTIEEPEDNEDDPVLIVEPGEDIQKSVLNGAQVTALMATVQAVAAGELPADSAIAILEVGYQLSPEEARRVVGSAVELATQRKADEDAAAAAALATSGPDDPDEEE